MDIIGILRALAGIVYVIFLPGFALSWALYPHRNRLPLHQRIGLSFVLSIIGVILAVLFIDVVLGVETTAVNISIAIALLILLAAAVWKVQMMYLESDVKVSIDRSLRAEKNVIIIDLSLLRSRLAGLSGRSEPAPREEGESGDGGGRRIQGLFDRITGTKNPPRK